MWAEGCRSYGGRWRGPLLRPAGAKLVVVGQDVGDALVPVAEDGAEVKLRAERKAGGMLAEMAAKGERADGRGRPPKGSRDATLSDLGIKKDESSRWQKIAGVRLEYPEG